MNYAPSSLISEVCRCEFHTWDGYIRHIRGGHPISGTIVVRKGKATFTPSASKGKPTASPSSGEPGSGA